MKNKLLFLLLIGMFLISFASATFGNSLDTNLVSYYRLQENSGNVTDSLNTYNGTFYAGIRNVNGKILRGYMFNGNNSAIGFAPAGSSFSRGGNLSVSLWVYFNSSQNDKYIIKDWSASGSGQNFYLVEKTNGFQLGNTGNVISTGKPLNTWIFLTVTRDITADNFSLYVNGKLNASFSTSLEGLQSDEYSYLFGSYGYDSINGSGDEVGVWSRVLTQTEINQLYNNGDGLSYITESSYFTANSMSYNTTIYETQTGSELYSLNISMIGSYVPTNAYLIYNGTSYPATITNLSGFVIINKTTPLDYDSINVGNNSFYYIFNVSSNISTNSNNYTQTKSAIQFGLCNATLTTKYLNISFKDEALDKYIKASIPTSTFIYYLGNGTVNKTYTFTNATTNFYYTFCASPSDRPYYIDAYVQYKNDTSYPQRIYDPDLGTYLNTTSNVTLYLLDSTDGIYSTFQVVNQIGQTLSNVEVTASRDIGGVSTIFATGTTGGTGTVTFWLNPDFITTITFVKSGYETYTFEEPPTQTFYTIKLGSTVDSEVDYRGGISVSKTPTRFSVDKNEIVDFTFTLTSSYSYLDNFSAGLYFGNGTLISLQTSTSSTGATLSWSNINVTNQSIYLNYNWSINSTITVGNTFFWVNSETQGRDFSIWKFFSDFNLYTSTEGGGLFGLDEFGKGLIAILILILVAGTTSYRYGVGSEPMILGIVFGVVLLLDTQDFIQTPVLAGIAPVDNFITIIAGILLIGFIMKEEFR